MIDEEALRVISYFLGIAYDCWKKSKTNINSVNPLGVPFNWIKIHIKNMNKNDKNRRFLRNSMMVYMTYVPPQCSGVSPSQHVQTPPCLFVFLQ